jgi:Protein of unknwon function (DUF3310)
MQKNKQIAGDHYKKMKIEPWEVIEANDMDFFEGNALKYLMRWQDKGGIADLDKAIHYIEKIKARAEVVTDSESGQKCRADRRNHIAVYD